ncbi:MAG: NADH-quinone oxidoreductase subunit L [Bacteroidia bacterium]|nr:NADH-quinone oxidoreductase subunit L [Bacteroidia bacterium]
MFENLAILVPLIPLIGFLVCIFLGRKLSEKVIAFVGSTAILISFGLSVYLFNLFVQQPEPLPMRFAIWEWISIGKLSVNYSIHLDQLSLLMMLVITGIGFLIHVYSYGYMHGDEGFHRFFAYLNLFVFFMLILVMGGNYLNLYIGWEGVGLCSYLLIGFWFKTPEYNKAANKAFIMNRIGDLGLLLGMFLLFYRFDTLEYNRISSQALTVAMNDPLIGIATLLLFVGAIGKSAQIPLFTWLPDAMAGPTPVSALIHAATMVTAGIYLIIRSNILYSLAPGTQEVVMCIGLITLLFAATIGLKQNDIKKVLAYSTVSQLGYMFFALGMGAYTAAFFHLVTHAFFKALLFLGSGSVIHAMGGEQDIRKMGGLKNKLPITYATFLIGSVAIAGIPPLAGFFSKDQILLAAYMHHPAFWILGVGGALLTAFYMFRLLYLTFHGSFRGTEEQQKHLHESPASMTIPLMVLAAGSVFAGLLNLPAIMGGGHWLDRFFGPLLSGSELVKEDVMTGHAHVSHTMEWILMAVSVVAVLLVVFYARIRYKSNQHLPQADDETLPFYEKLLARKYYVDEIYEKLFEKPFLNASSYVHKIFEAGIFDRIVNRTGHAFLLGRKAFRCAQSGNLVYYIFSMVIGVLLILAMNLFFNQP